jgi:hypothetical protein
MLSCKRDFCAILHRVPDPHLSSRLADLSKWSGEPLRTDSANYPCQYLGMMKRKGSAETARKIPASVKREMQNPRLTESVRNARRYQAALVAEEPPAHSE